MLTRWPEHTNDEHILLQSDTLLTLCEPTDAIAEAYTRKFKKQIDSAKKEAQPIVLNEDTIPTDSDDEYEPKYIEDPIY